MGAGPGGSQSTGAVETPCEQEAGEGDDDGSAERRRRHCSLWQRGARVFRSGRRGEKRDTAWKRR
jgi:hypothetical protein